MRIKISKSQWEKMGRKAGWKVEAQEQQAQVLSGTSATIGFIGGPPLPTTKTPAPQQGGVPNQVSAPAQAQDFMIVANIKGVVTDPFPISKIFTKSGQVEALNNLYK